MREDFRGLQHDKWTVLAAAAVGFAVFQLLGLAVQVVASAIDGAVYINAPSSVREVLVRYRIWEIYRTFLYSASAALCGFSVAWLFPTRRRLAIASVVVVIGSS